MKPQTYAPAGWKFYRFEELATFSRDFFKVVPSEIYSELSLRLYGRGFEIRREIAGVAFVASEMQRLKARQFVTSIHQFRNGAVGIVPNALHGTILSKNFLVYELDETLVDARFLFHFLTSPHSISYFQANSTGSATPIYPKSMIESVEIPLPPLSEQRRVVARIEELSAQIREARTLRHQATCEAEAIISARISKMFETSDCWGTVNDAIAKHRGAVRSGPFGSQLLHEEFTDSGVTAIGTRDVQTNRFHIQSGWFISHEKFQQVQRYQVFSNDVLCTIIGGSIGRFCVVPHDVPLAFTTKHIQALTLDSAKADAHFMSWMLNYHRRCRASLFSQVEGSAQPSLNAGKILATLFPLPPLDEQRHIVAELDALQAEVDALKRLQAETTAELDALLPAILDRAFKGEL